MSLLARREHQEVTGVLVGLDRLQRIHNKSMLHKASLTALTVGRLAAPAAASFTYPLRLGAAMRI